MTSVRVYARSELKADGSASVQADCNRATGNWHTEAAGKLTFGPLAATQTACPPGSISDTYLAQFEWVRSYVMEQGRLFLATMADGSIIEFAPVHARLAATAMGQEVRTDDAAEMQRVVLSRLFDHYAAEQGIGVSESEIDAYVKHLRRRILEDPALIE